MGTSVTPQVVRALYEQASAALSDVAVYLGINLSQGADHDLLMIGVDDAESTAAASSSDGSQVMATLGTPRSRDHSGSVNCAALSWRGDTDQGAAMDSAYSTLAAVEEFLRADPTLGGLAPPGRMVCQVTDDHLSMDVVTSDDFGDGAYALVIFTVSFTARI